MNRISAVITYLLTLVMLAFFWVAGIAILVAVVLGYTSPWMLLFTALFLWGGVTGVVAMRDWFSRIPERRVFIADDGFIIAGEFLKYEDVAEIRCNAETVEKRYNFQKAGRDHSVRAEIRSHDGRVFRLRGGQGPATAFGPSYGAQSAGRLMATLTAGHALTNAKWVSQ